MADLEGRVEASRIVHDLLLTGELMDDFDMYAQPTHITVPETAEQCEALIAEVGLLAAVAVDLLAAASEATWETALANVTRLRDAVIRPRWWHPMDEES